MDDIVPLIVHWCDHGATVVNLLCVCKVFEKCIREMDLAKNTVRRLLLRYSDVNHAWKRYFDQSKRIDLRIVHYLIRLGADVHARDDQALQWASEKGHLEVVQYLLSATDGLKERSRMVM